MFIISDTLIHETLGDEIVYATLIRMIKVVSLYLGFASSYFLSFTFTFSL